MHNYKLQIAVLCHKGVCVGRPGGGGGVRQDVQHTQAGLAILLVLVQRLVLCFVGAWQ